MLCLFVCDPYIQSVLLKTKLNPHISTNLHLLKIYVQRSFGIEPTLILFCYNHVVNSSFVQNFCFFPWLMFRKNVKYVQSTAILTTQNNHLHLGDNVNSSNGNASDLVVGALRHQRDLFSGSLGIPDVTTRVGSVIHAFETMARQRQALERNTGEKPYDSTVGPRYRSHRSNVKRVNDNGNRHKIILPSPKISPSSTESLTFVQHSFLPNTRNQFLNSSIKHNNSSSSNNLQINNNNSGQYFLHSNIHSNNNQAMARTTFQSNTGSEIHYNLANDNESSNFDSLNLDDDYRKSSFGKQSKLQPTATTTASIGTLGRNQHLNDATTSAVDGGNTNLRSSFQPAGDTENNSFSRNNPNVFFNSAPLSQPPLSATAASQVSESDKPASPTILAATVGTGARVATTPTTTTVTSPQTPVSTMRYYNHDNNNNNNSGNRRSTRSSAGNPVKDDNDGRGGDSFTSNDKFLRGTTVSQSFIKNVKNMRRKSSSYDLQTANASLMPGGTTANSSSIVGFRQKSGSAFMTTAARHLYRRAPKGPTAASDNDTDELTTITTSNIMAKPRESANVDSNRGSGKRKTFQPRTLDRAEI